MKTYTITSTRFGYSGSRRSSTETGTLKELISHFSYTLEAGKSYESEKGNKKINLNPRGIKSLVQNLNKAKSNSSANGVSNTLYFETKQND